MRRSHRHHPSCTGGEVAGQDPPGPGERYQSPGDGARKTAMAVTRPAGLPSVMERIICAAVRMMTGQAGQGGSHGAALGAQAIAITGADGNRCASCRDSRHDARGPAERAGRRPGQRDPRGGRRRNLRWRRALKPWWCNAWGNSASPMVTRGTGNVKTPVTLGRSSRRLIRGWADRAASRIQCRAGRQAGACRRRPYVIACEPGPAPAVGHREGGPGFRHTASGRAVSGGCIAALLAGPARSPLAGAATAGHRAVAGLP